MKITLINKHKGYKKQKTFNHVFNTNPWFPSTIVVRLQLSELQTISDHPTSSSCAYAFQMLVCDVVANTVMMFYALYKTGIQSHLIPIWREKEN